MLCVILRIFSLWRRIFLRKVYPARTMLQLTFFPKRPSSRKVIDVAWHKSTAVRSPCAFFPLTSTTRRDLPQRLFITRWTGIVKCFFLFQPSRSASLFLPLGRLREFALESFLFPCSFSSSFPSPSRWKSMAISRTCAQLKNYRPRVQLAFVIRKKRAAVDCVRKRGR